MTAQASLPGVHAYDATTLSGWRLYLARLAWMVITALVIILLALVYRERPRLIWLDPYVEDSYQLFASLLNYKQYGEIIFFLRYLVTGSFILIATLVFWRKSSDWLGILTSISLVVLPYFVFYSSNLFEVNYPFPYPWRVLVPQAEGFIVIFGSTSLLLMLFIFPDGRFEPRRLKKPILGLFILLIGLVIIQFLLIKFPKDPVTSFLEDNYWIFLLLCGFLLFFLGAAGQVYRYIRLSTPAQKQQTKWILFSILTNLGFGAISAFGLGNSLRFGAASIFAVMMILAVPVIVLLLPVSLAFSVLRYRLWDIDIIIRKTLLYSMLTGAVSVLYFGGVALSQSILTADGVGYNGGRQTADGSQPSAVVIVLTTLTIAAIFTPLRRRLQSAIDRRFYRQKYDAEKAMGEFSHLARSETDLQILAGSMVGVVKNTLQPRDVGLWLTPNPGEGAE